MATCLQFHFRGHFYRLTFRIGFSLLCLFFFTLCCVLGVWQWHRYQAKEVLLATYQQHLIEAPKAFQTVIQSKEGLQFQPVKVEGQYIDALTMLLTNRMHQGKVGFDVLTPFKITGDKKLILVDRGWVPESDREAGFRTTTGKQQITGVIKLENEYQFILGNNVLDQHAIPVVMQKIDFADIKNVTHEDFYPLVLRLGKSELNGFQRDWLISAVLPQRHLAYAVQWFIFALILLVAYSCFCCERVEEAKDEK